MRSRTVLEPSLRTAYLDRLGLDAEPPSAAALTRLHRAQVERVPYETFWLQMGERRTIDQSESVSWIARGRRGGYCFHLNGAFAALLHDLGYQVTMHVAGVHERSGGSQDVMGNHVALTVAGVPNATNPEGRWYLDVGLGDALYEPIALRGGHGREGQVTLTADADAWYFRPASVGSIAGVTISTASTMIEAFQARHAHNVTSPHSSFHRTVTAQRRHASGSDIVRGCVLTQRAGDRVTSTPFTDRSAWLDVLGDLFDLHLDRRSASLDALWHQVQTTHQAWLDSRPASNAKEAA